MGRIVKRGKRFFIQNTHTGKLGRSFVEKAKADIALAKLKLRVARAKRKSKR